MQIFFFFRDSGKIWEKNRRDRLNKTFDELALLLPKTDEQPISKLSKIEILSRSCKLIQDLSERLALTEKNVNGSVAADKQNSNKSITISRAEVACNTEKENIVPKTFTDQYVQCRLLTCKKKKVKIDCEIQTNLGEDVLTTSRLAMGAITADSISVFGQGTIDPFLTKIVSLSSSVQEDSVESSSTSITSLLSSSVRVTPALISTPIMTPSLYLPNYANIVIQAPPLIVPQSAQPSFFIINNNTQTTTNITTCSQSLIQSKTENGQVQIPSLKQRVKSKKHLKRDEKILSKKKRLSLNKSNDSSVLAEREPESCKSSNGPTLTSTPIKESEKTQRSGTNSEDNLLPEKLTLSENAQKETITANNKETVKDSNVIPLVEPPQPKPQPSVLQNHTNFEEKNLKTDPVAQTKPKQKITMRRIETLRKVSKSTDVASTSKPTTEITQTDTRQPSLRLSLRSRSNKVSVSNKTACEDKNVSKQNESSTAHTADTKLQFSGDTKAEVIPDCYLPHKIESSVQDMRNKQQTPPLSSADIPITLPDNEIETEIIQALTVPHSSAPNHSSVSPTAAYLVSFPVLSSGKQIEVQEQQDTDTDKVNLNDSSVRTMIDLENLFPSNLLRNMDTTNEQEQATASTKEKGFDTKVTPNEGNVMKSVSTKSTTAVSASITVASSSFLHDYGTISFPTKKSSVGRHVENNSYCPSFIHTNTYDNSLRQPVKPSSSTYSTQFSSAAQFSNQHHIFSTSSFDYRISDKNTVDQLTSCSEMPSNFTFSLTSSTSTDPKYTFNATIGQTRGNQGKKTVLCESKVE